MTTTMEPVVFTLSYFLCLANPFQTFAAQGVAAATHDDVSPFHQIIVITNMIGISP